MILERIEQPNDIKKIDPEDLDQLAREIRQFLLEKISVTGGHIASNLGTVELTMALHLAFDLPKDKIIWDVGHQSYTHKLLTGRKQAFDEIRCYGGISGFPKRDESEYDAFNTGHSSTSISAGLGMAEARDLMGEDYHIISVIGDGSLTGGMAYEALNNASRLKKNFIIVLNDNNMSISENVGGVSRMMSSLRTSKGYNDLKENVAEALAKIPGVGSDLIRRIKNTKSGLKQLFVPGMLFEDMGITYLGPVDGHDIRAMTEIFEDAKQLSRAVVVHVITKKGKGYVPAENDPANFHGVGAFDIATGAPLKKSKPGYSQVAGQALCRLAEKDPRVVAITAAMTDGVGLKQFKKQFPDRFFDVGIAEQHAATFAAGLAVGGLKPYFCVYSSFLQRAYDQIIHDVCLQKLPVTFLVDRSGIVGNDGETHQGIFDLSFLQTVPNMTVLAPKNGIELIDAIQFSGSFNAPLAIRYPRGAASLTLKEFRAPITFGKAEMLYSAKAEMLTRGNAVAILAAGSMVETGDEVRRLLKADGYEVTLVNARFVRPFDEKTVRELAEKHRLLVTLEENVLSGGFGEHVAAFVKVSGLTADVLPLALPDGYVEHGNPGVLMSMLGMDAEGIRKKILDRLENK